MIERYNELFVCDFLAGTLHWRVSRGGLKAGDRAGTVDRRGYRRVQVDGKLLLEHRVIVSMIECRALGDDEHVDHENGVLDDNRIENLRIVDRSVNMRNQRVHRAGKPVGVTWQKRLRKWLAQIRLDGRMRTILRHHDQATAARAFEIVDTMLKDGATFDDAKAAARMECLSWQPAHEDLAAL